MENLGPQCAGDAPFTARMRRHQSWYRAKVLQVPYGTGPQDGSKNYYGNMLTKEDGACGRNFLNRAIFEVAKARLAQQTGVIEEYRLLHNMLSSQPMCFNLFGPMAVDLDLATRLWRSVFPDEVAQVTRVAVEYAPEPSAEYLADRTAFDAFVEYRTLDGKLGFTGIETKLTEPFSQKHYDGPSYRRWMQGSDSPWRGDAHDKVDRVQHNQLWRNHLLAIAMQSHPHSPYAEGRLLLVRHSEDIPCSTIVSGYQGLLADRDSSFVDMPLNHLVAFFRTSELNTEQQQWLDEFELRYLSLDASSAPEDGGSAES